MCGTLGAVRYEDHADVMSVVNLQRDQHSKAAPLCHNGAMRLRSLCPENVREPFVLTIEGRYTFSE